MATLLIKGLKDAAKKKLKEQAELHHRSMNQEAVMLLERELLPYRVPTLPPPLKPLRTDIQFDATKVIRESRDSNHGKDPLFRPTHVEPIFMVAEPAPKIPRRRKKKA